jgi:hypothetical protein
MKSLDILIHEHKSRPYGVSLEKFIYDYFAIHINEVIRKEERQRAIDDCLDAFLDKATEEGYFKKRNFSYQECKALLKSL